MSDLLLPHHALDDACGPVASDRFVAPHATVERVAIHRSNDRNTGVVELRPRVCRQEASDMQVEQLVMRRPGLRVLCLAAQREFLFGPSAMIMPVVLVEHLGLPRMTEA